MKPLALRPRLSTWTRVAIVDALLLVLTLAAFVAHMASRDPAGIQLLVSGALGGAIGTQLVQTNIALRRRKERQTLDRLPSDISLHRSDGGAVSGIVRLENGDLVGIDIPQELVDEYDPARPETIALLAAYVFEQFVPAEFRVGVPSVADVRQSLGEQDDEA